MLLPTPIYIIYYDPYNVCNHIAGCFLLFFVHMLFLEQIIMVALWILFILMVKLDKKRENYNELW